MTLIADSNSSTTSTHANAVRTIFTLLKHLQNRFLVWRRERHRQKIDRLAFETLLRLDEETLADLGYTKAQVTRASKLPLEINAAEHLRRHTSGINLR